MFAVIIYLIGIIIVALLFRHRNLFRNNKEKSIDRTDKMYIMYDGTQEIYVINDYASARLYHTLKIERTYKYLGFVFNKLLKGSIGAHTNKEWLMMKKPLSNFFNTESVRNHFGMITKNADKWIEEIYKIENQEKFDQKENESCNGIALQDLGLDRLTIAILSNIIYGELSNLQLDELYSLSLLHNKMMIIMGTDMKLRCPIMSILPSSNKNLVNEFWNRWCKFNDSLINNLQKTNSPSLLSTMIEHDIYSKNKLKLYHTLYEVMLFNLDIMIDSFANLVWTLATNNECQENILKEIKENDLDNFFDINQLEYTDSVINESARLNPGIVITFAETTLNDTIINNVSIKKGTKISLNTRKINRDPTIWENPDKFNPTRFNGQNKFQFHRFGIGPRKCMGNVYANYILKIGITKLIKCYTFKQTEELIKEKRQTIPNLSNYNMLNKIIFTKRIMF